MQGEGGSGKRGRGIACGQNSHDFDSYFTLNLNFTMNGFDGNNYFIYNIRVGHILNFLV